MALFSRNPAVKFKLIKRGTAVDVVLTNTKAEDAVTLIYAGTKKLAKYMGKDHREFLNDLIALDKRIIKNTKEAAKAERYHKN